VESTGIDLHCFVMKGFIKGQVVINHAKTMPRLEDLVGGLVPEEGLFEY
jgi:hypothetical protein